jgi:hypothetical protein
MPPGVAPESVTPESPAARGPRDYGSSQTPETPRSSGRAVASGTLLSVGAVDPRGKTERTLETPRMYFSQADTAGEVYFKPGKIPAVTVHQTIETETVKLSDSIDPRRAKTLPRIDRAQLLRYAEEPPDSEGGMARSQAPEPGSLDVRGEDVPALWNQDEYDPPSFPSELVGDGQIHASLSPFRDQQDSQQGPSFDYEAGVPTRVEPLAGRRWSDTPPPPPDPSTVPTQRDLPQHRIEASQPPPPPVALPKSSPRAASDSAIPLSEGPRPTTASIAADEPQTRPLWQNAAAFALALLLAVAVGWWLTSGDHARRPAPPAPPAPVEVNRAEPPRQGPPPIQTAPSRMEAPAAPSGAEPKAIVPPPRAAPPAQQPPSSAPLAAPRKSTPKPSRETIF